MVLSATATPRRTQAERRAETRGRLLDATLECLAELGYTGTTTTEVVRRAGLSRGAQVHHFPTKAELVVAAVEHLFHRRHEEFRQAFAERERTLDAALDLLWEMFQGPTFDAWLELVVAGRPHLAPLRPQRRAQPAADEAGAPRHQNARAHRQRSNFSANCRLACS